MEYRDSKIYFEGVLASEMAKEYGTPLYLYEAGRIRENYRRLHQSFQSRRPGFKIYYALKANSNPAIAKILITEGAGLDCASQMELILAQKLGLKGEAILFSGNNLSDDDLKEGIKAKALFNLDDITLLSKLLKHGKPDVLSFRINPAIGKSNVHESDKLAGEDAKFGIPWEKAEAAYKQAKEAGIQKFGVHMMTGSCVTDPDYFAQVTKKLLDCVGPLANHLKIHFEFINIGGGFGIPYEPGEGILDIEATAEKVTRLFREKVNQYRLGDVKLFVEPGRYFVGDAGFVLGRVHAIKESYKKFVGTDVSMNILARPMLYGAYHGIYVDGKKNNGKKETVTVCGQACENADAWGKNRELPVMEVGDLVVVENAGAYGYAMSFPYNGRLRAAEVLVDKGSHRLIRRRETFEDWVGTTI